VDGAFGLWAAAAPERARLLEGFELADSWATDAHKWLNVPYDCGVVFCKDPEQLAAVGTLDPAGYIGDATQGHEPDSYTPQMSRRARGVDVWAAIRHLGRSGLADLIERCCRHAERFADGLESAGYSVLNDVVINQVLVSFGDDELTERVIEAVQSDGTCFMSGTTWQGQRAMRISVSSWATTEEDVERSLEAIVRIADQAH
jgi:glutamate/tyrosine decarboxylase-like PLP-dependent enzyme